MEECTPKKPGYDAIFQKKLSECYLQYNKEMNASNRRFESQMFIACFSEKESIYSSRMWGHYANNHAGVCAEYDWDTVVNASPFGCIPIKYTDTYEYFSNPSNKAEETIDEDIAEKTMNNMLTGKFTLMDMKNQFDMMNKMGPMQQVLNMIPGMGNKISKEASQMTEEKIESYKIMMSSMTEEEMLNPKIIKQSRVQRIARGSGVDESEVKELLRYYNNTRKTMKGIGKRGSRLSGGAMNRMMGQFMNR